MRTVTDFRQWLSRYSNVIFFVGGFVFDAFTLVRIDSTMDLLIQSVYLAAITWILIHQIRYEEGHWQPTGLLAKCWHYETEAIHFFYGGLLSAYVIFYFKSTTASRSIVFLLFTIALMFANEMPQIKKAGSRMRLGLHAFCLVSFLNYLIPVLVGRMGWWSFALSVLLAAAASWALVRHLTKLLPDPLKARLILGWPPVVILTIITIFYVMKWIPPVPLSMQFAGIYHQVEKQNGDYRLVYEKPRWYRFWRHDSRPFYARQGDVLTCFVRVFAPRRFHHQVLMRWSLKNPNTGRYQSADLVNLAVSGGRGEGFRGYGAKSNYEPGDWRVDIETEDGRAIGSISVTVIADADAGERQWRERRM